MLRSPRMTGTAASPLPGMGALDGQMGIVGSARSAAAAGIHTPLPS